MSFDLGDVYLLTCGIHQEIDRIQHPKLEWQLLMFLDIIMGIFLRALADLLGCPIGAISQDISYPFTPDDPVKQPEGSTLVVGRAPFKVRVSQDPGLFKLKGKGHYLRG